MNREKQMIEANNYTNKCMKKVAKIREHSPFQKFQIGDIVKIIERIKMNKNHVVFDDHLGKIVTIVGSYAQIFCNYDTEKMTIDEFNNLPEYEIRHFHTYQIREDNGNIIAWFDEDELEQITD